LSVHLVVTVIATDEPGIVERVSQTIAAAGASWLESRMTRLAGEFAGIVEVGVAEADAGALQAALEALASRGMHVHVKTSKPPDDGAAGRLFRFELTGADRPGIVREISEALARHQVNVHDLETRVEIGAMSGEAVFRANALLEVPNDVTPEALSDELETIAQDLMVDVTLGDAKD